MLYKSAVEMRDGFNAIGAKDSILSFISSTEKHLTSNLDFFSVLQSLEFANEMSRFRTELDMKYYELKAFQSKVLLSKAAAEDNTTKMDAIYLVSRIKGMTSFLEYTDTIVEFFEDSSRSMIKASKGMQKEEFEAKFTSTERGETIVNQLYERAMRMIEEMKLHIDEEFYIHDIEDFDNSPF